MILARAMPRYMRSVNGFVPFIAEHGIGNDIYKQSLAVPARFWSYYFGHASRCTDISNGTIPFSRTGEEDLVALLERVARRRFAGQQLSNAVAHLCLGWLTFLQFLFFLWRLQGHICIFMGYGRGFPPLSPLSGSMAKFNITEYCIV